MPTIILRPIFLTMKNRVSKRTSRPENRRREFLLYGFAIGTMVCIYACCAMIFPRVARDQFFFELVPQKLIEITFFSFFLLLLLSNTVAAIGNLYTATSTNLLLIAPISSGRFFFGKLLETLLETSVMYFIFLGPVGIAYCQYFHLPLSFLLEGVIISIPFLFIPAGLGLALAIGVVRVIAFFKKKALLFSLISVSAVLFLFYKITVIATEAATGEEATASLAKMIGIFSNPNPQWFPPRWIADILSRHLVEVPSNPALLFALLISTACGTVGLGFITFDLFFLSTWSNADMQEKEVSVIGARRQLYPTLVNARRWIHRIVDPQIGAIIFKDSLTLVRDRSQAIQMLMYLVIAGFHITSFRIMGQVWNLGSDSSHVLSATLLSMNFLFAGFIVTSLMARLVYPAISLEGRSFWVLLVAPLDIAQLVKIKFFSWLPLSAFSALAFTLAGALALGASGANLLFTAFGALTLSIGCTGLAIGLGAIFASFEWEAPNQISSGLGSMVLLLFGLAAVTATSVLTACLYFFAEGRFRVFVGEPLSLSLLLFAPFALVAINILIAHYACKIGTASLITRSR